MLALIDGDVIAHLCCKSRFLTTGADGREVYKMVENKDTHSFSKEEDREYLESSWGHFKKALEEILEACFAEDFLMAVKSPENYRSHLYPEYKMNRHKEPSKMNKFVPIIRRLAIHEDLAIESVGREADDLLRIWAEQAVLAGDPYVIVSIDKDLDCIPGKHYHIKHKKMYDVSVRDAIRFFYQQLLSGDPTDNIPGVPGIGPIKAEKFLYNLHEEEEFQEIVVEMYMSAFEDDWYEMLLSNGKLLYLQKSEDDYFSISQWPVVQAVGIPKRSDASTTPPVLQDSEIKETQIESPKLAPKSPSIKPTPSPVVHAAPTPEPGKTAHFRIPTKNG